MPIVTESREVLLGRVSFILLGQFSFARLGTARSWMDVARQWRRCVIRLCVGASHEHDARVVPVRLLDGLGIEKHYPEDRRLRPILRLWRPFETRFGALQALWFLPLLGLRLKTTGKNELGYSYPIGKRIDDVSIDWSSMNRWTPRIVGTEVSRPTRQTVRPDPPQSPECGAFHYLFSSP